MMMKSTKEDMLAWMLDKVKTSANPYEAESWLLTARTLGLNYDIDLCAYKLHSHYKKAASAAQTIERMYVHYSGESRFWDEITKIIEAVRNDTFNDETSIFYRAIFHKLQPDFQQIILLDLVAKQTEKMDKCRFLLLLLRLFPDSTEMFWKELIDVLTELEVKAPSMEPHENIYTQLLVCDVLPILLRNHTLPLSESLCLDLFQRAIRYYLSILSSAQRRKQSAASSGSSISGGISPRGAPRLKTSSRGSDTPVADYHHQTDTTLSGTRSSDHNWESLLQCFSLIADRCGWEVGKRLKSFRLDHLRAILASLESTCESKIEIMYTTFLIFLNLVFKFSHLAGIAASRDGPNVIVVLVPPMLNKSYLPPHLQSTTEGPTPPKIAKTTSFSKEGLASATLVPSSDNDKALVEIFSAGALCSKLLADANRDELVEKVLPADKCVWVKQFVRNSILLTGDCKRMVKDLEKPIGDQEKSTSLISEKLQLAGCYLGLKKDNECVKTLLEMVEMASASSLRAVLMQPFGSDNWHYAFASEAQLLSYSIRCIIYCLGRKLSERASLTDAMLGHSLVLSQYEWPRLHWLFDMAIRQISSLPSQKRMKFTYQKLFSYVYRVEILEEIAYLNANRTTEFSLNITETETTRKIGASTRHSVKGQTGDVRSMLEAQASVAESTAAPSMHDVFLLFLIDQKASLIELL